MAHPENIQGEADDEFAQAGTAPPIDIEFLLRGYLIGVLAFDRNLRLEFSTGVLRGDGASATPIPAGLTLLVAEDHPANRRVMGLVLDEAGMEAVVTKPIDPARLIATIARCLGQTPNNNTRHGEK